MTDFFLLAIVHMQINAELLAQCNPFLYQLTESTSQATAKEAVRFNQEPLVGNRLNASANGRPDLNGKGTKDLCTTLHHCHRTVNVP